jgi:hypothetical protein
MRSRLLAVLGALAIVAAGLAGSQLVSTGPAAASDEPAHCSASVPPDRYSNGGIGFVNRTTIRSGPYWNCVVHAWAVAGEHINVYCAFKNTNGMWWFYVQDLNQRAAGWARFDDLHYSYRKYWVSTCYRAGWVWYIQVFNGYPAISGPYQTG